MNGVEAAVVVPDISEDLAMRAQSRLLQTAINTTDRPVLILDAQRRIVRVNRAFSMLLGYGEREAVGRDPTSFLPSPSVPPQELEAHRSLPWGHKRVHAHMQVRTKSGQDLWMRISSIPFAADEDGDMQGYSVDVLADVTEEQQIRSLEQDVLGALAGNLSFEELGTYLCRRIETIAPGVLVSVCGIADNRMRPWAAPSFPPEYGIFFEGMEIGEGVASCGTAAYRGKSVMVRDIATDPLWAPYKQVMLPHGFRACWTYPLKRRDGSVAGTFAFYFKQAQEPDPYLEHIASASVHLCNLAIEREENRKKMARLVKFDTLTGLPNFNHLNSHIDELLASGPAGTFALFCMGLDRFTDINATLGPAIGDQALLVVAARLQSRLRPGEFLSRADGDQFIIVSPRMDARRAAAAAERLLDIVGGQIDLDGQVVDLSVSVGINLYPEGGTDRDMLLANAVSAMRRAKRDGGGDYQFFSPDFNRVAQDRVLLGAALKRAIAGNRLNLKYQPQVRSDDGTLHGVEALSRWHDDERGDISPGKFVPLAEEIGQIEALGRWALREACQQMAEWRAAGVPVPVVSVNLSPVSFRDPDLSDYVAALLEEFALPGASLTVEITESAMMELTDEMRRMVDRVRDLGVGLSIDDFGTGFSSLSNLVNLPVTEVKIDQSFVRESHVRGRHRSVVDAVCGIGHSLGLTVVAEGVETDEQRAQIAANGGVVIQGYIYSPPLGPDELADWFKTIRVR